MSAVLLSVALLCFECCGVVCVMVAVSGGGEMRDVPVRHKSVTTLHSKASLTLHRHPYLPASRCCCAYLCPSLPALTRRSAAMPHVAAPSRQALEQERLHRHAQQPGSSLSPAPRLSPLRLYLLGYNILSALLWGHLLVLTLSFLLAPSRPPWHQLADRLSGSYDYHNLGWCTKWTQTLAVLEAVHAALGWVRSPLGTVASQVASRLWTVWGVVEAAPEIVRRRFRCPPLMPPRPG